MYNVYNKAVKNEQQICKLNYITKLSKYLHNV